MPPTMEPATSPTASAAPPIADATLPILSVTESKIYSPLEELDDDPESDELEDELLEYDEEYDEEYEGASYVFSGAL